MTFHAITLDEVNQAYETWGCNCGPAAIAAILGMPLHDIRPTIPLFDQRRYTSPQMMSAALINIGCSWEKIGPAWPQYGLARIQWEGPWTNPGVPMPARYRYTHWVGSWILPHSHGIFDVNAIANGSGWTSFADWSAHIVPFLTSNITRANGRWHITHGIAVENKRKSTP